MFGKGNNISAIRWLKLIFLLSGVASLFYQVAWQRILTLYYGVGFISITLIVSVFMFGLGFGALWGGRIIDRIREKVVFYAIVELAIGGFGLGSIRFLKYLSKHTAGADYLYTLLFSFCFLAIPTFLMGATLPIICRIFSDIDGQLLRNVSLLYFLNTLGAAFGTLICGYIFISVVGLDGAVYVASGLNMLLGLGILLLRRVFRGEEKGLRVVETPIKRYGVRTYYIYGIAMVVGFLAIGYEIVWFRLITVFVKDSPYAFSSILFVYLLGIALGSYLMNVLVRRKGFIGARYFYIFQAAIGACILLSINFSYYLGKYTALRKLFELSFNEYWHPGAFKGIEAFFTPAGFIKMLYLNLDIFIWPLFFVFIPTLFMGASFPLLSRIAVDRLKRTGSKVGQVYFFNVLGNVLGGLCTGFFILPYLKTERTLLVYAIIGLLFLIPAIMQGKVRRKLYAAICLPVVIALIVIFPAPGRFYQFAHLTYQHEHAYLEEGRESVIVAVVDGDWMDVYINGVSHGDRPAGDLMREALDWICHAKKLDRVLIIGFGTGTTMELILRTSEVKEVELVEISGTLLKNSRKIPLFNEMLSEQRVTIIIDDARRYLYRTDRKYDLIVMDPLSTKSAYSNNIYSKEFLTLLKEHLYPGGVLGIWTNNMEVMPRTVVTVFDKVKYYGQYFVASQSPIVFNEERYGQFMNSLLSEKEVDLIIDEKVIRWAEYKGDEKYIKENFQSTKINTDYKPIMEYYFLTGIGKLLKEIRNLK